MEHIDAGGSCIGSDLRYLHIKHEQRMCNVLKLQRHLQHLNNVRTDSAWRTPRDTHTGLHDSKARNSTRTFRVMGGGAHYSTTSAWRARGHVLEQHGNHTRRMPTAALANARPLRRKDDGPGPVHALGQVIHMVRWRRGRERCWRFGAMYGPAERSSMRWCAKTWAAARHGHFPGWELNPGLTRGGRNS